MWHWKRWPDRLPACQGSPAAGVRALAVFFCSLGDVEGAGDGAPVGAGWRPAMLKGPDARPRPNWRGGSAATVAICAGHATRRDGSYRSAQSSFRPAIGALPRLATSWGPDFILPVDMLPGAGVSPWQSRWRPAPSSVRSDRARWADRLARPRAPEDRQVTLPVRKIAKASANSGAGGVSAGLPARQPAHRGLCHRGAIRFRLPARPLAMPLPVTHSDGIKGWQLCLSAMSAAFRNARRMMNQCCPGACDPGGKAPHA